jgi:dihydroxy-acid dehydratase
VCVFEAWQRPDCAHPQRRDRITIDARGRQLQLEISGKELRARRRRLKARKPRYTRGVLAKYARQVSSASTGAVTDHE